MAAVLISADRTRTRMVIFSGLRCFSLTAIMLVLQRLLLAGVLLGLSLILLIIQTSLLEVKYTYYIK
jgi:hypothetical protein